MPTPLSLSTAMYHSRLNPLMKITRKSETVETVRKGGERRLHKAFLRYHDPENWQTLREWLRRHGYADLIGNGPHHLVPAWKSAPVKTGQNLRLIGKLSSGKKRPAGSSALKKLPSKGSAIGSDKK